MKILIIGAGFTGCTLARILSEKGHEINIIEKLNHIGGLSFSKKGPNGIIFEPFGARVFHTKKIEVKNFINRFCRLNGYKHRKGIIIQNVCYHYPISLSTIRKMPQSQNILKELQEKSLEISKNNFEETMISVFGKNLYYLFIYNYTKKMWGVEPKELTSDWATERVELTEKNAKLFKNEWQGLPVGGYTEFFKRLIRGIPIRYNKRNFNPAEYNLVLYSGRIDELLNFSFGELPYRSLVFYYEENTTWENDLYGTINLPDHPYYIRKANFRVLYKCTSSNNFIQFQKPEKVSNNNPPMYPINTKTNNELFYRYLFEICGGKNIIPVGRLGLYKYLNMDSAVWLAMNMIPLILKWNELSVDERFKKIKNLID